MLKIVLLKKYFLCLESCVDKKARYVGKNDKLKNFKGLKGFKTFGKKKNSNMIQLRLDWCYFRYDNIVLVCEVFSAKNLDRFLQNL